MPYPKFLQRIVCLFLAIQVTVVGTGFSVHEHMCLVKGITTFSFFHKITCQPEMMKAECAESGKEACWERGKCCLNKATHYKIQTFSGNSRALQKESPHTGWIHFFTSVYFPSFARGYRIISSPFFHVTPHAPPLSFYGRSRLIFIQSFLI